MSETSARSRQSSSGATRTFFLVVALFLAGVIALAAMRWVGSEDLTTKSSPTVLPVEVVEVEAVDEIVTTRRYTGRVAAGRAANLSFERTARLAATLVDEGDRVRRGQALARLDARDLKIRVAQLEAQKAQAEARLDELRAGPRVETIAAARARVEELERRLELAEIQSRRRGKLLERQAISQEEFDRLDFESRALNASLDATKAQLVELERGTRSEQVRAQEAVVAGLAAQVNSLELDIEKSVLAAPFEGRIAERLLDEGVVVQPGIPVFRILEDARPEVRIGLPPEAARAVEVGDSREVEVGGRVWQARAQSILPELEAETRTATVVFELPGEAVGEVFAGQIARLLLDRTETASGFWLPLSALTPGTRGLWACFALAPADESPTGGPAFKLERLPVEILYTEDDRALVRGVLESGDRIVRDGVNRVTEGQLVRPAGA